MSTQQDIYAAGSKNRPPMLNKDNYVSWPCDPNRKVPVAETFHEQSDEELTNKEIKQMEADDQAIQTILMGLPEDIYADVRCYNCRGMGHLTRNCTVRPRRRDATYLQTQLVIAQKEEAGI
uniref:Ribonuclease H-like domain-containing protein n=1 Tax=Tanacetum cinerariifolium TaxID=118510 RepID=A0A699GM87_TANCI|nr:ribonuclease H-like domain-containing protein [Tanacetum cinerariifolium]